MNPLQQLLALDPVQQQRRGVTDTPREIHHQPEAWRQTAARVVAAAPELQSFREDVRVMPTPRLLFSGAGTSHFIGLSLQGLFQRSGLTAAAVPSTEIVIDPADALPPGPFGMVSFARSGNSPEGNHAFRLATQRTPGLRHLVITCNEQGELYRIAGEHPGAVRLLLPPMTNDRGLAMTSSYTSMVIAGQGLAALHDLEGYVARVGQLATAAERLLEAAPGPLAAVAALKPRRALFLGSGTGLGAATEAHLKVQEMTAGHVVGKAESFLGLRHGPMAVIDEQTLVVCFVSGDPLRRRYELDLMREMRAKALGQQVVAVTPRSEGLTGLADLILETGDNLPDDLRPPLYVLVAQLLALFLSLEQGLQPDTPSAGGVINRVVQGVTIY